MAGEEMTFDGLDMDAFIPVESPEGASPEEDLEDDEDLGFVPASKVKDNDSGEDPEKDKTPAEDESPEGVGNGEEEGDGEDDSDEEPQDSQPSLYSSLAKVLQEEGVLPSFDSKKKIETVEDLVEAFREEIKANELSDLTDEQKQYLQAIRSGVPAEQFAPQQSAVQNLKSISDEEISSNEDLRKQLIYQDFILKGYSAEKAEKYTQRSIDIGEDESDAKDALSSIIELQEKQLQVQLQQAEEQKRIRVEKDKEQLNTFKKYLSDTKEFIPGVKMTPKIAEKVFEQAVKPIEQGPNGVPLNAVQQARVQNPIEFEAKLNYLFYITKGFEDFSKIATSQKSKAVKELDDLVKGNTFAPKASAMGGDFDYTPPQLKGDFDDSIINNIK
jgi:hypothetical protein